MTLFRWVQGEEWLQHLIHVFSQNFVSAYLTRLSQETLCNIGSVVEWVPQKQAPKWGFEGKWFVWKVSPGPIFGGGAAWGEEWEGLERDNIGANEQIFTMDIWGSVPWRTIGDNVEHTVEYLAFSFQGWRSWGTLGLGLPQSLFHHCP